MTKIYRADHCGSLVRPQGLRQARKDCAKGKIKDDELSAIEDKAILDVLALQRETGLEIYSDGEFRRGSWLAAISEEFFEGMHNEGIDYIRYPFLKGKDIVDAEVAVPPNPIVTGKLKLRKRITAAEIQFLKQHSPGAFKITIPSPVTLSRASYKEGVSDRVYPTWKEFVDDYTEIIAGEINSMVDDGVTYVQIDAPHYTRFIVPERRKQLTDLGINLEKELRHVIEAENKCLRAARRPGVTVAVHICLGTFILGPQGPLGGAGDYDETIVGRLLNELDADVFLIEYSERAGSLETLLGAPKDKIISLGMLNVRDPRIESVDELLRKVEIAEKYLPIENVSLCPNCGFSGAAVDAFVTEDIQKQKLGTLVEASRRIWG